MKLTILTCLALAAGMMLLGGPAFSGAKLDEGKRVIDSYGEAWKRYVLPQIKYLDGQRHCLSECEAARNNTVAQINLTARHITERRLACGGDGPALARYAESFFRERLRRHYEVVRANSQGACLDTLEIKVKDYDFRK